MVDKLSAVMFDTSVLMEESINYDKYELPIVISDVVLSELDELKTSRGRKRCQAQKAIRDIYNAFRLDKIKFCEYDGLSHINDDKIIELAKNMDAKLYTLDLGMFLKGQALGVDIEIYPVKNQEVGSGYIKIKLNDDELADFYTNKLNLWNVKVNQYAMFYNNNELVDIQRWNGVKFEPLKYKWIDSEHMGRKIKPINTEQKMAFDLMQNDDIDIKLITGKFGTGKDYIMLAHALSRISCGEFNKLVYVRNNIQVADTKDIGYLPGSLDEKILPYAQLLSDHLGGSMGLEILMENDIIELQHLGFIRGRGIHNSIVYVSEAENMTKEHMALLMGRVGSNSKLYINGDLNQVDDRKFLENSGIVSLINSLSGHENFGYVELKHTERSEVARMSELLK